MKKEVDRKQKEAKKERRKKQRTTEEAAMEADKGGLINTVSDEYDSKTCKLLGNNNEKPAERQPQDKRRAQPT